MPIPIEAEFANPPVFSDAQEKVINDEYVGDLADERLRRSRTGGAPVPIPSPSSTAASSVDARVVTEKDPEKGGESQYKIVEFEVGKGENPKEWSKLKKWLVTMATSMLCLAVALGSSMPTGDLPDQREEFEVASVVINLSIALFVVGFGVGPLLFAPLSEVIGRRPVYAISIFFYFIFTLPSCLAQNIETMLVGRAIAGIASSAPMTNVGGTISDLWDTKERGFPMAVFSGTLFLGPALGPFFGGWIAQGTGSWRWIYWVLFIFLGVVFASTLVMPETLAPVLLTQKAKRIRKETGDNSYLAAHEVNKMPLSKSLKIALVRPFVLMFLEPIVLLLSFYLSFLYAILYLLFFAFPIAFEEVRGFGLGLTGTTFLSIVIGVLLSLGCLQYQEVLYAKATRNGPCTEARLFPMMFGAILMPISLFIFAFTGGYEWVHWIAPCISGFLFGLAMLPIYVGANAYIVDSYAHVAASAIAAKTLMRSEVGASVPLWVQPMFHNMGFQYAGLTLALIATVIGPVPFFFYFKGGAIRAKSTRAYKEPEA